MLEGLAAELSPVEDDELPIIGPSRVAPERPAGVVRPPRLARHTITLEDGHRVSLAVAGRGIPLVVAHGFTAEGLLYAQTLSRLVDMRFKVVAVDMAGHGGTQGLPTGGANLDRYADLLARTIEELGIRRAVLAGHSLGGRLVTEVAATHPERAIAVILLDAVVGDTWDRIVDVSRLFPAVLGGVAVLLVIDTLSTIPVLRDPGQARKLARLVAPTLLGHVRSPWRLLGPAVSILRSRGSRWMLQRIAQERIPLFAIHGDRDLPIPLSTSRSAARRAAGDLVVVHGASHSWLLKDPEALPAVIHELMKGRLGTAWLRALMDAGVDPNGATEDDLERAFYEPDAPILGLTPSGQRGAVIDIHRRPRYRFTITRD